LCKTEAAEQEKYRDRANYGNLLAPLGAFATNVAVPPNYPTQSTDWDSEVACAAKLNWSKGGFA